MKKTLLLFISFIALSSTTKAQTLTLDSAIVSGDTVFCNGGNSNKSALTFNPDDQLYYSNNSGGTVPNEYYDVNGVFLGNSTATDWRGMWYNTNTQAIEGNVWGGNMLIDSLDINGAFSSHNNIGFVSNMPNIQSARAFNYDDTIIYYYESDSLYSISRVDGTILPAKKLTGVVDLSNVVSWSVVYTGVPQNEIGLYNKTDKELYLYDKATASLTNTIYMPTSTFNISINWNIAYTNNMFWLYNPNGNEWVAYNIFEECAPIQNTIDTLICEGESYTSPLGTNYTSSSSFTEIISTAKGCDNTLTINLTVSECSTNINKINAFENVSVYPNPTSGVINLDVEETLTSIRIMDISGRTIQVFNPKNTQLDISSFTTGIYFLEIANAEKKSIVKIIKR